MTDSILVREASAHDLESISGLWRALIAHHEPLNPRLYGLEAHSEVTYQALVRRQLRDAHGMVIVAVDGQRIVGYLMGAEGYRSPVYTRRRVGMIYDMFVDPDYRRHGVGRRLVEAAVTTFRAAGLEDIQVNYDPTNEAARAFWSALGFGVLLVEAYRTYGDHDVNVT
ncbi:MAG: GNAT family N-acetyltransferase [Myxococcota bacterium]|nr:GNAT family N-acetyltransferase [Myxococcota bacterium]